MDVRVWSKPPYACKTFNLMVKNALFWLIGKSQEIVTHIIPFLVQPRFHFYQATC